MDKAAKSSPVPSSPRSPVNARARSSAVLLEHPGVGGTEFAPCLLLSHSPPRASPFSSLSHTKKRQKQISRVLCLNLFFSFSLLLFEMEIVFTTPSWPSPSPPPGPSTKQHPTKQDWGFVDKVGGGLGIGEGAVRECHVFNVHFFLLWLFQQIKSTFWDCLMKNGEDCK